MTTTPSTPKVFIKELKFGEAVTSFFMVRHAELKAFRAPKPGAFLVLTLTDKTGAMLAKVFDKVPDEVPTVGTVMKIAATVEEYNGALELRVTQCRVATEAEYVLADYVPTTDKDMTDLMAQLQNAAVLADQSLALLVGYFYSDENFRHRLAAAPVTQEFNHNYFGGLAEHITEMLAIADVMLAIHPEANADLVRAGVLLCNIGKIPSYTAYPVIAETDAHREQGHIMLGYEMVIRAIAALEQRASTEGFTFETSVCDPLKHILAAQSGRLEWGSPVTPKTLEAAIVHGVESLSAKANALARHGKGG